MSRQSELAELSRVYDSSALSNRNLIINGAMQVAQRGTSSTSSGYVALDRFYVNQSGASTTFSQETNSNPSETGGLQKYARLNVSSSSDFCHIRQPIEDVTSVPSGTVTLSFYAKGTAPAGGLYTYGIQNFGSGGSSDVDWTPVLVTSTLTSSWVRYTAQITVPSIDGKTIGSGSYFLLDIGQYSNTGTTAYDLNITGVQLEVGDTATPFEHRKFSEELQACKRYFERITNVQSDGSTKHSRKLFGTSYAESTSEGRGNLRYQYKRTEPSITHSGLTTLAFYHTGSTLALSVLTFDNASFDGARVNGTSTGTPFTDGDALHFSSISSSLVSYVDIDAEL